MIKFVIITAASLFGLYIFMLALLYLLQEKLLFSPVILPEDYKFSFTYTYTETWFKTENNGRINALYFRKPDPKGIVIYHHGNAGNLQGWANIAENFLQYNYDVFIYDYRQFGKSTGHFNEENLLNDALILSNKVAEEYKGKKMIIYGRSLGSAMALYASKTVNPDLIILETPFYDLPDVALAHYPLVPVFLLRYNLPNHKYLTFSKCPVIIFHGDKDDLVPLSSAKKLAKVDKLRTEFHVIPSGKHNGLRHSEIYKSVLDKILR